MTESQSKQLAIVAAEHQGGELKAWMTQFPHATVGTCERIRDLLPGHFKVVVLLDPDCPIADDPRNAQVEFLHSLPDQSGPNKRGRGRKANQWVCSKEEAIDLAIERLKQANRNTPTGISTLPPPSQTASEDDPPIIADYDYPDPDDRDSLLGRGGAGRVWLAKQKKLQVWVALKVVDPDAWILEKQGLRRYYRLVTRHPDKFLPIFDPPKYLPEDESLPEEDRRMFYSTELADCLLQDRFYDPVIYDPHTLDKDNPVRQRSAEDAVEVTLRILEQVFLLHNAGLIHGDIKLGNVIFYKGHPTLIDVTTIGPRLPYGKSRPRTFGTRGFIPPEGHGHPSGDLYSLGKLLYLLLVGGTDRECPGELVEGDPRSPIQPKGTLSEVGTFHPAPLWLAPSLCTIIAKACRVPLKDSDNKPPGTYERAGDMMGDLKYIFNMRQYPGDEADKD